jgi:hypothetical protein
LIKRCFDRLDDFLYGFEALSGSRALRELAKDYIKDVWQHHRSMRRDIAEKHHLQYFVKVADECLEAGRNNNFTASTQR